MTMESVASETIARK